MYACIHKCVTSITLCVVNECIYKCVTSISLCVVYAKSKVLCYGEYWDASPAVLCSLPTDIMLFGSVVAWPWTPRNIWEGIHQWVQRTEEEKVDCCLHFLPFLFFLLWNASVFLGPVGWVACFQFPGCQGCFSGTCFLSFALMINFIPFLHWCFMFLSWHFSFSRQDTSCWICGAQRVHCTWIVFCLDYIASIEWISAWVTVCIDCVLHDLCFTWCLSYVIRGVFLSGLWRHAI